MFSAKKSILISNILDPYTKNKEDIKLMYKKLFNENRYSSIETRIIDDDIIEFFNLIKPSNVSLTFCINGELSRRNLSLCSCNEEIRKASIEYCKSLLVVANKTNADYLCLASGKVEDNALNNLDMFIESLSEIFIYTKERGYHTRICIEPLDQYAHKKNTIGSLDMTIRMINKLESLGYGTNDFVLAWDSAHVALNEDDFEKTIKDLSKYIYKIHFATAILDKNHLQYGDHHLDFDFGFMDLQCAKKIYAYAKKYINHKVDFACEIKENVKDNAWKLEKRTFEFLNKVIED